MEATHNSSHRVVITGLGAITPIGNTAAQTWDGLITGRQGAGFITLYDRKESEVQIACEVKNFDPAAVFGAREARRLDRSSQFALVATREALEDSGLKVTEENSRDIAVVTGTGIGGISTLIAEHAILLTRGVKRVSPFLVPMMMPNSSAGNLSLAFGVRGPCLNITTACASATNAIGEAFEMLRVGRVDAAVVNGNEAAVNPLSMAGFHNMTALSHYNDTPESASRPFDKTRSGFVTGEGAATLIMETLEHAQARGARIYGEVVGYGATADARHMTAPDFNGAVSTMSRALNQSGLKPRDVNYICAHGTSTQLNDASETKAIKIVFGEAAYDLNISSNKSMIGHTLGAAGAVNALACVMAIRTGIVPPTVNYVTPDPDCDLNYTPNKAIQRPVGAAVSNSFGFGGHNASLVFKRFE